MNPIPPCPICAGTIFTKFIATQDYSVSQQTFEIVRCTSCQFLITTPIPDDLNHYYQSPSYVSHVKEPTTLIDNIYHLVRKFTLRWKVNLIKKHTAGQLSILDYGCGTGDFINACQFEHWTTSGVEPSDNARAIAIERTQTNIEADLLNINAGSFHVITLWHVLEHVPNLNETLAQLKDKLTDSGIIFIAVPNYNSNDALHYQNHWAAYDVPRHLWHFSQDTMHKLLSKHQLILISTVPMKLDSFYVSMLSEKYKRGKSTVTSMARGLIRGALSNIKAKKTYNFSSLIYIVKK